MIDMEKFRGIDWLRINDGDTIQFRLKDWEEVVGIQQFQLWDNNTRRFSDTDQYTPGRKERWIRQVIRCGEEKTYNMSMSKAVNEQFMQLLDMMKTTNADPLKSEFIITRTGAGLATRYKIRLAGSGEKSIPELQALPPAPEEPKPEEPKPEEKPTGPQYESTK